MSRVYGSCMQCRVLRVVFRVDFIVLLQLVRERGRRCGRHQLSHCEHDILHIAWESHMVIEVVVKDDVYVANRVPA